MQASSATGSYLGAVVFETLAGIQCDTPSGLPLLLGDWPGVFYLQGVCGMCVAAVWWRCVRDTPGQHRYCSDEERRLIASRYDRPSVLFIKTNSIHLNANTVVLLCLDTAAPQQPTLTLMSFTALTALPVVVVVAGVLRRLQREEDADDSTQVRPPFVSVPLLCDNVRACVLWII